MRYLVVGLGNIGQKRQRVLGNRCVATADPYQPQASYRDPLDVPLDGFEAVVIATPNEPKLEYIAHFLRAGKHVLVEKPLILPDDATASELQALSSRTGAIWYTSYNHRFEPHVARLKSLLEQEVIGPVYRANLLYGNGTVQNCIGTWRDGGHGMLADLGCHLIDLAGFLLGYYGTEYHVVDVRPVESSAIDYGLLATPDRRIVLEFGSIFWKNTFSLEVIGQAGSLHVNGLCKWGPSKLVVRQRVYPSGVPLETEEVLDQPDPTWEADIQHFEDMARQGRTSLENDLRISRAVLGIAAASPSAAKTGRIEARP